MKIRKKLYPLKAVVRLRYHRILMCFITATLFTLFVVMGPLLFCKYIDFGYTAENFSNSYKMGDANLIISITNPMTIVSFGATLVGISLTILGFSLNSFSKRSNFVNNNKKYDVQGKTVELLLTRYRGYGRSLLFLNLFEFPIITKAFCLVEMVFLMLFYSYFSKYKIFYLLIITAEMFLIIISILIETFSLFADSNFSMAKAAKISKRIVKSRLYWLCNSNCLFGDDSEISDFCRADLFFATAYLKNAYLVLQYSNNKTCKNFIIDIDLKHNKNVFAEIAKTIYLSGNVITKHTTYELQKETENKASNNFGFLIQNNLFYTFDSKIKGTKYNQKSGTINACKNEISKFLLDLKNQNSQRFKDYIAISDELIDAFNSILNYNINVDTDINDVRKNKLTIKKEQNNE